MTIYDEILVELRRLNETVGRISSALAAARYAQPGTIFYRDWSKLNQGVPPEPEPPPTGMRWEK